MSPEEIKDVQLRMGAGVAVMDELMTLPETFMWTKMGWESGVRLADILRQKEVERQAQGGLFLWGIGTTVSAAPTTSDSTRSLTLASSSV